MSSNRNEQKWIKASVLAGLWAGVEIVAGSSLHNLRIPLAGTFLTLFSIILVIGFFQLWKQPGIIWRAGILTALMKSISPSAVILGPMIAITMEGLVLELSIRFFGKNIVGFMMAGSLTMLGALLHKIIRLFLLYGFDLFKIYEEMFRFAVLKTGLPEMEPLHAVIALFVVYAVSGAFAAVAGYYIGSKALKEQSHRLPVIISSGNNHPSNTSPSNNPSPNNPLGTPPSSYASSRNNVYWDSTRAIPVYSPFLLVLHIVLIPLLLFLLSEYSLKVALLFVIPYLIFVAWRYEAVVGRLKKGLFWLPLVIILLLTWFFGKSAASGLEGKMEDLIMGFAMIFRALVVVMGFSGLSTELQAPVLQQLFFKAGLKRLYLGIHNAFLILPAVIDHMETPRKFIRHPLRSISLSLQQASSYVEYLERAPSKSP